MSENTTGTPWSIHVNCPKSYLVWGFTLTMLFITLFMNGSIIFVSVRKPRPFSVGNIMILHLTVADCLLPLTTIPYYLTMLARSPLAGIYFCQMSAFFNRFAHCSSIYLITIVSACRWYSVLKPFHYRFYIKPSRINKVCLGAWCLSLVFALTPFFGLGEYEVIHGKCLCTVDAYKYPYNWFVLFTLFFVLPTMINTLMFVGTAKYFMTRKKVGTTWSQKKDKPDSFLSTLFSRRERNDGVSGVFKCEAPDELCHTSETTSIQETDKKTQKDPQQASKVGNKVNKDLPHLPQPKSQPSDQSISNGIVVEVHNNINNSNMENIEKHNRKKTIYVNPANQPENPNNLQSVSQSTSQRPIKIKLQTETHLQCIDERESSVTENSNDVGMNEGHGTQEKHPKNSNDKKKVCKEQLLLNKTPQKDFKLLIVVLIFASFILLCGPNFIFKTFYAISPASVSDRAINNGLTLSALNSLINPFLYGLLNKEIRGNVKNLLCFYWNK